MFGNLCRICGKNIKERDAVNLFENQNKQLLLQIKDLTGIRLKNNYSLPKLICCVCKKDLIDAHKFREDFLKVQKSFRIKSKIQTKKELIEATEFVQVFVVKEEVDINSEHWAADEEKEINIVGSENLNKKGKLSKESKGEINALELKPSEENTLEDTKAGIEQVISCKVDVGYNTLKASSEDEDEDLDNNDSGDEYKPQTEILTNKKNKLTCKSSSNGRQTVATKRKCGRKPKEDKEQKNIFICDQCGNNFTCRYYFTLHMRRHSGDRRWPCELCPGKFLTSSELKRHMRTHTGERPFACKFCDRRFADYSTRLKHERTHTNEKPYMCSHCDKSFTTSEILKCHMLTHTGERHFKCDVCNRAFTRRTHLVVHFRSITHKQAVEKKNLTSQEELLEPKCLVPQPAHIPTFPV